MRRKNSARLLLLISVGYLVELKSAKSDFQSEVSENDFLQDNYSVNKSICY